MAHPQSGAEGFSAADEVFIYKYDRQASGTMSRPGQIQEVGYNLIDIECTTSAWTA